MFTWLDALTLAIILVVVAVNIFFLLWLAGLPGSVARSRTHPQADAIAALGWLSLLTLFATWPVALVWAYSRPVQVRVAPTAGGESA
jgi:hypothetical protein